MRTHNIDDLETLKNRNQSKGEAFADCKLTVDYALPQNWLDSFASWCKEKNHSTTYDLIRSTTCWAYSDHYRGPITCCNEVYDSWLLWELEQ